MNAPGPRTRVFCLSMPRNGTASVERFFRDAGLLTADAAHGRTQAWSEAWLRGDFEAIFAGEAFASFDAFAGRPWSLPDFYKVLFHRFPGARFVLLTREPANWFRSLVDAGHGHAVEPNRLHAKVYRRELDLLRRLHAGEVDDREDARGRQLPLQGLAAHYQEAYRLHNSEVMAFFGRHAPHALHWGELEDPRKWQRLGAFLGVDIARSYRCHLNASATTRVALAG
jgi:hypothetical protein